MSPRPERWVPVFPLQLVLLPGESVPLHIFEPRYRAMTRRCLESGTPFTIFLAQEEALARIGCEARIARVLRRHDDGRLDILCRGEARVTLRELREHEDGYLEGRVESLLDAGEEADADLSIVLASLHEEYRKLVEDDEPVSDSQNEESDEETGAGAPADDPGEEAPALDAEAIGLRGAEGAVPKPDPVREESAPGAFRLAAGVQMDLMERQALLESESEVLRQQFLVRHLSRLLPQVRALNDNRRRIRGNGKPRPPA